MNFNDGPIDLQRIRSELIRLEDSIIFGMIERGQFAWNPRVYRVGGIPCPGVPSAGSSDGGGGAGASHLTGLPLESKNSANANLNLLKEETETCSFLLFYLHEMECVHSKVRRYTSPDEYAFTSNLPAPLLPPIQFPANILHRNNVNVNQRILEVYVNHIVPAICKASSSTTVASPSSATATVTTNLTSASTSIGNTKENERVQSNKEEEDDRSNEDGNFGSCATKDMDVLQNLSRRIHFGKFVAEAKFLAETEAYTALIEAKDREAILSLLTNKAVEQKLLRRLKKKALIYGQEIDDTMENEFGDGGSLLKELRISPGMVANIYEMFVIPLTKEVEVEYLMQRLS